STCGGFHSALDALLAIRTEHRVRPEEVVEIVGTIPHLSDAHAGYDVPSITGAQYRLPYCLAVALHEGHANAPQFTESKIRDGSILQTAGKVRTEFFERVGADMPGRVTVVLRDGRTLTAETPYPKGSPKKPLTEGERREKFRALAEMVLAPERVTAIERAVDHFEDLPSPAALAEVLR
ncbi:MAG: MmgE/PrpD family protein, partial [Chloroflexi bacterium]|nr:MmgE/PrpD family protein [Chloroflexota bacterium]